MLAHAAGQYEQILCCGDIVGYGAFPNETAAWCEARLHGVVRGNHDKAATGQAFFEDYTGPANFSLRWTQRQLSPTAHDYLRKLPHGPIAHENIGLMHGSPTNEDQYLIHAWEASDLEYALPGPLSFFGHTHRQGGFAYFRRHCRRLPQVPLKDHELPLELELDSWYLLNPGSVGQPRDGDPRAAYALYDSGQRTVFFRRVAYDTAAAGKAILDAGLPAFLASRLKEGR